ncbi:MAG: divergent PAP2 family protein [Candidatus Gastranaerophilales bacterium]|nr:divergent PAP2 family protein [Candidatus Gastranaerophilales bacterium]
MDLIKYVNTGYEVLFVSLTVPLLAQTIKFSLHLIFDKKIDFRLFTTTGGMPSAHSASVMGLSTMVGLILGFNSVEFAIALGYALVVMYDAAGVRRAAGKQAACLNRILDDFYKHEIQEIGGRLKELLGHTPLQVFWGAVLGVIYAYYVHAYFLAKVNMV